MAFSHNNNITLKRKSGDRLTVVYKHKCNTIKIRTLPMVAMNQCVGDDKECVQDIVLRLKMYRYCPKSYYIIKTIFAFSKGAYFISPESTVPKLRALQYAVTSFKLYESK